MPSATRTTATIIFRFRLSNEASPFAEAPVIDARVYKRDVPRVRFKGIAHAATLDATSATI
jgi:hypothetical protein